MLTLILGGARSGKSDFGMKLASASGRQVFFVATMEPGGEEMRARIAAHRAQRPGEWRTIEEPRRVVEALHRDARPAECVLLDCMTLWVSNLLIDAADEADVDALQAAVSGVRSHVDALIDW